LGLSDLRGHVDRSSSDLYGGGIAMRFREIDTGSIHERVIAAQKYNRDQIAQDAHCTATSGECHGFIQAESRSGTLTSEGYENNAACEWLLTCPDEGSVVVLSFSSFGTESCCDHVQVYDGSTQWDMSLLTLQGHYNFDGNPYGSSNCQNAYGSSNCQNAPEPVASSGRSMLVRLTSDSSVTDNGFHASFECSAPAGSTTSNVNATVQYSEHGFAERQHSGPQFSSPAEADAWFRQSFPALAIEVAESVIDDSSTTFRYAVRQWTAHAYQAYPFLRTSSSGCGQDQCWLERDVEFVSPSSSECTHDCERETTADKTLRGVISAMSNSLLRTKLGMADASLTATIVPMPEFTYWQTRRRVNDSFALWLVMYPLLTMLLIPTLASMLASEKEKGLLDMVRMEGGRTVSFFLGNWLFTFAYSLMFSVLFVLTIMFSGAADADSGVQMPGSRVAALVVLWAHAQTGFVHFIGLCIFRKARHAALFGAFAVIVAVMVGWTATIMEAEHLITSDLFPVSCLLIPPLAYTRTVGVLLWYGGGEEFDRGLIMLAVDGFLYFFCAVCYSLWPQEEARQLLVKLVRRAKGQGAAGAELLLDDNTVVSTGGGTPFKSDDVSVVAERERASSAAAAGSAAAIRIEGLVKDFTAISGGKEVTKRAVNELYLSIERGEVFGMLGPNGAGKTTTIQMLTGMTPPTGGSASVCGFDIARQMDHVKCVIGVCPQFDVLWEDLTVRQHLRFYSLLRGLPRARIEVEARRLAEKMELDGDAFNKPASTLSGGAKRRLSIAIALAGKPPCLFFDEPTTGLDPETRRQIWRIIKAEQRDNAIVITTHSMEEADALCSRVGIMAGGSLRAVGSQMYLKSRFGDGFKVTLNCVDESTRRLRRVNDFIMSFSDKAQFVSRFGAHLTYTVPMAGGDVAGIFNRMETSKSELGVVEWGVTQASLEEVFIKVVLQWEEGVHGQSFRNAFANPMLPPGGGDGSSSDED
jgi:ABC-type multidrug transport system ATPase subunit